jgi:hypothetical protein
VPGQQGLRCDNRSDFSQSASSESFGLGCEPATLIVGKSKPAPAELFPKYSVFLPQVVDRLLLLLVHPSGNRNEHESERIQNPTHASTVSSDTAK